MYREWVLLAAAGREDCPHRATCRYVLEHLTRQLATGAADPVALRATIGRSPDGPWVAYARRLLGYRVPAGPVNRAAAEQIGTRPARHTERRRAAESGGERRITVESAANGRLWRCRTADPNTPTFLYVSRRSGAWRTAAIVPLSDADLRTLR